MHSILDQADKKSGRQTDRQAVRQSGDGGGGLEPPLMTNFTDEINNPIDTNK